MSLLAPYRRPWAIVLLGLLALPMAIQGLQPRAAVSEGEGRRLSSLPAWPRSWQDWRLLPRHLDRFLADHFGLRDQLVQAHALLRHAVVLPTDLRVVIGRDRWLFLNGDGTIEQATGQWLRRTEIDRFAERAAGLQQRLEARGTRFLVAIPPNSPTIMRAQLPAWAVEKPPISEYDLMMRALAARGVAAIDLRPPLLAAGATHPVYRRTDTHWNRLGALVAYNAVVAALQRPDWVIDPARVLRGFEPVEGGDLARLLGVSANVADLDARIDLAPYAPPPRTRSRIETQFESGGDVIETGRKGPAVVVVGDSFTQGFWDEYFALHAGRYVWMHHEHCGFRVEVVEAQRPAIVILAPTERLMICRTP